jgi:hypothetical protein
VAAKGIVVEERQLWRPRLHRHEHGDVGGSQPQVRRRYPVVLRYPKYDNNTGGDAFLRPFLFAPNEFKNKPHICL